MSGVILSAAALQISAAAVICTAICYRRKISVFSEELCRMLDDMTGRKSPDFNVTADTVDGKIHLRLKRLHEILNGRAKQAGREMENMQSLISDISHQVKTPAANLKMYMEILSQRDLEENTRREFLALSRAQTEKLEFLTQALVKMSRLESGIISCRKENVSAAELIGEGLMSVMPAAEEKQIAVQVDCPDRISACCDKKWTAEAVFNLLDNAVKYTSANGSVTVSAGMNEFYTQIRTTDSGAGILESEQTKIFGRFYRSEAGGMSKGSGSACFCRAISSPDRADISRCGQNPSYVAIRLLNCFSDYANCITSASSFFNSSNDNAGTHKPISSSDNFPIFINLSAVSLSLS